MIRRPHSITAAIIEAMEPRRLLAMPTLWTSQGPGGGGSYFSAAVNGSDLWVASDMSGIYHSANFGQSWQQLNFHTSTGGMNGGTASQVQFTSDPKILYIPSSNLGVAKSTNGGASWSKLSAFSGGTAYWMAADPTTTTKILVASGSNIYVSSNGGTSFTTAYSSSSLFVAGAFFDGTTIYVGTNKGLLVSTNGGTSFALASTQLASGQFMISFTGAKEGTTTRLMAISSTTNPTAGQSARSLGFSQLNRLDVGGAWVNKTSVVPSGEKPHFVQMARNNISVAYLGGTDSGSLPDILKSTNGGDSFSDVYKTRATDGGGVPNANINTAYEGTGGDFDYGWGGGPWSFVVSSADANRAMTVDSGFIHVTSDGGATWQQAYVDPADENPTGQDIPNGKPYRTAGSDDTSVHYLNWVDANTIVAGYTDTIGWRSTDGGSSWGAPAWYTTGGNGDNNTIYKTEVATDGKMYGASSSVHDMYQSNYLLDSRTNPSYQNGRVIMSSDQGANWSLIHEFSHPVVWEQLDPNNANRMYAMVVDGPASSDAGVAGGVWVTSNLNLGAASTWTKLTNPPRTQGHPYILRVLKDGTLVATYSGRRFDDGTGEKFTDSSGVFVSTDNGTTWVDRSAANMHWYTKEITIDPTDPTQNTWYVGVANGFSGTGNDLGDVYRTTNRGVSWTKMNLQNVLGVVSMGVNSITINPTTKEMYVATETRGIFYAPDVTAASFTWSNFSDVTSFPHAWVERVFVNPYNPRDIWVATFGGGIKRGTTLVAVNSSQHLYAQSPNKLTVTFAADVGAAAFTASSMTIATVPASAPISATGYTFDAASKTGTWTLPASLVDGNYHATLLRGSTLAADYAFDFFVLAADVNHDHYVNTVDFTQLAMNFNKPGVTFVDGDVNFDGKVNALDFNVIATKFGASVLPSGPVPALFAEVPILDHHELKELLS